ncbi:FecR domain-containing protein [Pseudomonas sp. LRF_L74]|uniref:FecR domain-containing protein n=1 Tax=Pseudomonas sp. LRF_L74 TaxID=3369422 RepID=UPI003F62EC02
MSSDAQRRALRDAAQWFAQMCANPDDPAIQHQWQAWHARQAEHQWAWQRLTELQAQLGSVPQQLAWPVMDKVALQGGGLDRRTLLKCLLLGAGVAPLAWQGYRAAPVWLADLSTRTGEQRREILADGTLLVLDTATAVDVVFDAGQRLLILRAGEIHVTTGKDARPFRVRSVQGEMRALGTRFAVRQLDGITRLNVYEHAVAVRPERADGETVVEQGRSVSFDRQGLIDEHELAIAEEAWAQGRLVVDGWRLDRLVEELQRYRPGYLGCAPEVAHLRVSGSYLLSDIDVALNAIARSLPVRIERHTRYWTRVVLRG